jgi:GH24 family phage-related lysozyme (muramidase)
MYEELKEQIKEHEGFVPRTYSDSLGKRTIGFGHLCVEPEQWDDDKEYTREELESIEDTLELVALSYDIKKVLNK